MELSQLLQGKGTEFGIINSLLILVFVLHKFGVFKKIKFVVKISNRLNNGTVMKMKVPGNPNDKPGKARECLKHMTALAVLNTEMAGFKDQNKNDHNRFDKKFDRIFALLDKRRGR